MAGIKIDRIISLARSSVKIVPAFRPGDADGDAARAV
jgi:hypothetical protein